MHTQHMKFFLCLSHVRVVHAYMYVYIYAHELYVHVPVFLEQKVRYRFAHQLLR